MGELVKVNGEWIEDRRKSYITVGDLIKKLEKLEKNKRIFHLDGEYGFSKPNIYSIDWDDDQDIGLRCGDYFITDDL